MHAGGKNITVWWGGGVVGIVDEEIMLALCILCTLEPRMLMNPAFRRASLIGERRLHCCSSRIFRLHGF